MSSEALALVASPRKITYVLVPGLIGLMFDVLSWLGKQDLHLGYWGCYRQLWDAAAH